MATAAAGFATVRGELFALWHKLVAGAPVRLFEILAMAALLVVALTAWRAGGEWFRRAERLVERVARRRGLAILLVGLLAAGGRAALLPWVGVPEPRVADEFGYLLAADTFSSGRLTNPPHPMWVHFETFHIMHQPTYASVYPVAQGLALAAGKVLAGHPWVGVWVTVALMGAALCWMLQQWLPPKWALLGGVLVVLRLGILSYWINSYWGGAIAAAGRALVLGAWPGGMRRRRVRNALILAAGLAVLANSRPYEGLVLGLSVGAALLVWMRGPKSPPFGVFMRRVLLPIALLLAVVFGGMAYYFWRVTGNPLRLPAQVYWERYLVAPVFLWQSQKPEPAYRHEVLRAQHAGWEVHYFRIPPGIRGLWLHVERKMETFLSFYLGPVLTLPLVMLPWTVGDRRMRFLVLVCGLSAAGLFLMTWTLAHYAAPMTGLFYPVMLQCLRHVRVLKWRGESLGLILVGWIPFVCMGALLLCMSAQLLRFPAGPAWRDYQKCCINEGNMERVQILGRLRATQGRHLVLVRYKPNHNFQREWVWNEADIDAAKAVWARDMGEARNAELLSYFPDRRVWLLEVDDAGCWNPCPKWSLEEKR